MSKEKPEHIRAALQVLEDLGPEQQAEFRKLLPIFAAKAAQMGESVTEEFLQDHMAKGADHLQDFVKGLRQKPVVEETPLDQYKRIKDTLRGVRKNRYEELTRAVKNKDLGAVKLCLAQAEGDDLSHALQLAAYNGHLDTVRYLAEEKRYDIREHNSLAPCGAAYKGHFDIIRYCDERGCDIRTQDDRVQRTAAQYGHLDIVKYCVEEKGSNIRAEDDIALSLAAEYGHLDIVKYCIEQGCDAEKALAKAVKYGHLDIVKYCVDVIGAAHVAKSDYAVSAAGNGRLDIVKYLAEDIGCKLQIGKSNAVISAAQHGHLDIVKYCVEEQGCSIRALKGKDLKQVAVRGYFDVVQYCGEQGCVLPTMVRNDGLFHQAESMEDALRHYKGWIDKHGICPSGLLYYAPHHFKAPVFNDILPMLATEDYRGKAAHQYAYETAGLFGSTNRVLAYLEKWGESKMQPLHDIIQDITLPQKGRFNNAAWADAVLKHGPKMARLVKFADRLPEPLKNGDGSWSYLKTREEVASFAYRNGARNPDLASLCMQNDWDEVDFESALKHIEKYQQSYAANDNHKPGGHIPDVQIDGEAFDKPGYLFYKLPDGDLRGLFLGEMTGCCQHLAGLGAACASHGFLSEYSGFYAIENKETGEIVGQSWAWRGEDEALVLDSLESLSGHFNAEQWQKLIEKLAEQVAENASDITALHIGTGGATPMLGFNSAAPPSEPKQYNKYRDSHRQYQVWRR